MYSMRRWFLIGVIPLLALGEPPRVDARSAQKPTPAAGTRSPALRGAIERAAGYLGTRVHSGEGGWSTTQGALLLGPKFEAWARTLKVVSTVLNADKPDSHAGFAEVIDARLWSLRWLRERPAAKLSKPTTAPPVDRAEARRFEEVKLNVTTRSPTDHPGRTTNAGRMPR